jgi:hypothetical protein
MVRKTGGSILETGKEGFLVFVYKYESFLRSYVVKNFGSLYIPSIPLAILFPFG